MLALRLHPDGQLRLHDEPVPRLGDDDALVHVAAVGLCGSDRHWLLEGSIGDAAVEEPLVLGHEFAGIAQTGRHRGRLVAADPTITCGQCVACRAAAAHLCIDQRFAGYSGTDGALRELVAWPERLLHPLAPSVDATEGALVEPLAVALHSLDLAGDVRGMTVGVVGCGPIGLLIVSLAVHARAAAVLASEPLDHRVAAAAQRGATPVRAPLTAEDREAVLSMTGGRGLDVVFEVAGDDAAVDAAVGLVRPGGQVILVGIPAGDTTSFTASAARRKELVLRLVRRSTEGSFGRAVKLAEGRSMDLRGLVTRQDPLSDAPRAFAELVARQGVKVIVEPGGARA
ncbi:MAG: alcohol dehydrogenase catalytic domain-containing protein [Chloroflexota bacterium]|nr:alcohol dehydrogenase catalytic domain-containing protein [Chloroflexota bacterium]